MHYITPLFIFFKQHNQGCDSEAYSSPLKTNFSKNLNTK